MKGYSHLRFLEGLFLAGLIIGILQYCPFINDRTRPSYILNLSSHATRKAVARHATECGAFNIVNHFISSLPNVIVQVGVFLKRTVIVDID